MLDKFQQKGLESEDIELIYARLSQRGGFNLCNLWIILLYSLKLVGNIVRKGCSKVDTLFKIITVTWVTKLNCWACCNLFAIIHGNTVANIAL